MQFLGVIPARYASTRFPGKPLAMIQGKSMIQRVYEQALQSELLNKVVVATDDERIFKHVKAFGGSVQMTAESHSSGTDRCLEVVAQLEEEKLFFDVVLNIQGDEPFIDPKQIDQLASVFLKRNTEIATLIKPITSKDELESPNAVKVVIRENGMALYFSRFPIPFFRGGDAASVLSKGMYYKHLGIYAYRKEVLRKICELPKGKLEQAESLEQLRWLENGYSIQTELTHLESIAVDTPEDLLKLTNKP